MSETLLKDLIEIPHEVHKSDFVVSLNTGIQQPDRTLDQYVVTPELVDRFDAAIRMIGSAVASGDSKGAYLHGSFGSGKSHFMAVLHLILRGNPKARSIPELAPVIQRHDDKLAGRDFLLVPCNMIGAKSMEARLFDSYVDTVRQLHPDADLPALYLDDQLLDNARQLRDRMGDEAFFEQLSDAGDDDLGDLGGAWDAASFEKAVSAPPGDEDRQLLVSDVVSTYFSSTVGVAAASGEGYVEVDDGLGAMSSHAQSLGYEGIILFLDELVLWFATQMADPSFVQREGPKVARLVEAGAAKRPVPLVSLIARQRDLREFVGEGVPGAERLNFSDILKYWEGRFETIELPDSALPAIVSKRLLEPRSEAARQQLDDAFDEMLDSAGSGVRDVLLTREGDETMFRQVYPFSPALVDTLVAVSSFLQRERTALRLLQQLLVEQRDRLAVGDLVPLGDLYDVIAGGEEPFSSQLRKHFDAARRAYRQKIEPVLREDHGLTEAEAAEVGSDHSFTTDARLLKTLLLAELVPEVDPMRGLTARRLAALNHGTVRTPIRGQERAAVLTKLRRWQGPIGELRLEGDEQDPTVSLQLTGVDTQAILERAQEVDNVEARRRKIRELVAESLDLSDTDTLTGARYRWVWRGSRREVDVKFANVRDQRYIPGGEFRAEEVPRVIIDFPFDEAGWGPADDHARVQELREQLDPTATVCWLPRFLTQRALDRLGELVMMDHILTGDRFESYTTHLSPQDRTEAHRQIESQADALRGQLKDALRHAYGLDGSGHEWVRTDLPLADQFPALDPTMDIRPPTAASMTDAFEQLLDQLLGQVYPAHPEFEEEVRLGDLRTCLTWVKEAAQDKHGRVEVPRSDRSSVRKVLGPLKIAATGEAHLTLKRHWKDHFLQRAEPGTPITVEQIRRWIDEPEPMGLEERVANLVVCTFALQDDRVLTLAGQPIEPTVDSLDPRVELRTQKLPDPDDWEPAVQRGGKLFGVTGSPMVSAAGVATFVDQIRTRAGEQVEQARGLVHALRSARQHLDVEDDATRLRTAVAARDLLEAILAASDDLEVVEVLASAELPTSPEATARSTGTAGRVTTKLEDTNWELIDKATDLGGRWEADARSIRERLTEAAAADELTTSLVGALRDAERAATDLLGQAASARREPKPSEPSDTTEEHGGTAAGAAAEEARLPSTGEWHLPTGEPTPVLRELLERSDELESLHVHWVFRS